ncbi:mitochondrial ribosomal protein S18B isoform X2 [Lycorma delicatula]|uniref:mitochondrial ribosomal protein S18B isoform X2 n=1 Tax=Lycorma delicatula TaxID=130591 RepID=UPI003F515686
MSLARTLRRLSLPVLPNRSITLASSQLLCSKEATTDDPNKIRDASKDRTQVIPVETSIRYLESSAYKTTYGNDPVWKHYRRNFKGQLPPRKTRKTCIRGGVISTGSPCPVCRDEYLVLDEKNIQLLKQFISPFTDQVLDAFDTGLCQKRQMELLIAVERARDTGAITFDVPFRKYNYSDYGVHLKQ